MIGRWAEEQNIWLILIVLILFLINKILTKAQHRHLKSKLHQRAYDFIFSKVSKKRTRLISLFYIFGFILLVLGMMRFQTPGGEIEVKSQGIEVVLLADVSDSMTVEDLSPNRLSQMKYDFFRFIDLIGGHKVGLIAFAGSAHVLSPLTNDPSALKMYVDSLSPLTVSTQGTNIGNAIELAIDLFKRGGKDNEENSYVTRALLIASDGEDLEPETLKQVKKNLNEYGIKIYTLAYGTESGGKIPERDSLGYLKGYKKNEKGEVVISQVKGEFLKDLALQGGGEYFLGSTGNDSIKKIIDAFNKLDKQVSHVDKVKSFNEHYSIFIWPSLIFFLLAIFLPKVKNVNSTWKGRLGLFLILFLITESSFADFKDLRSWYFHNRAIKEIKSQKFLQGKNYLSQALKYDSLASEIHIAFGYLAMQSQQWDEAIVSFEYAEKNSQSAEEQFISRFNLGVAWQAKKDVDAALKFYLSALEIKPDSRETKINIELLLQQNGKQGEGDSSSENSDENSNNESDDSKNQDPKKYAPPPQNQKPQFKSEELSEADMKRILDELRNQEQKIRSEYNKKEQKERPRGKDW